MDDERTLLGNVSLGVAIIGFGFTAWILVSLPQGGRWEAGIAIGNVLVYIVAPLLLITELVSMGFGLMARNTPTGRMGVFLSVIVLAILAVWTARGMKIDPLVTDGQYNGHKVDASVLLISWPTLVLVIIASRRVQRRERQQTSIASGSEATSAGTVGRWQVRIFELMACIAAVGFGLAILKVMAEHEDRRFWILEETHMTVSVATLILAVRLCRRLGPTADARSLGSRAPELP